MNKAKVILSAICVFAAVGGALAYKAAPTPGWIKNAAGQYIQVTIDEDCPVRTTGCKYTTSGLTFQFLKHDANGYYPVAPLP